MKRREDMAGIGRLVAVVGILTFAGAAPVAADQLERDARASLELLYATNSVAKMLGRDARGILVFPQIVKAGFMFGGQIGDGVLFKGGRRAGHFNSIAGSYGLQAGIQKFGYALFFMNQAALQKLIDRQGFEVGVGPSVVIVDEGVGRSLTNTTAFDDVYAFIFDQKGLMAGIGIQGSKITRVGD